MIRSLSPLLAISILTACPVVTEAGPLKRGVEILERIKVFGQIEKLKAIR